MPTGPRKATQKRWGAPVSAAATRVDNKPGNASNTVRRNVIPQPAVALTVLDGGIGIAFIGRRSRELGTEYLVHRGLIGALNSHRPLPEV